MKDFAALKPRVVLGVAAHPDDLDFSAGGTMATFAQAGADVYYLILTDGCKGTSDKNTSSEKLVHMRQDEQRAAGKILGVKDVIFLAYEDGMLEITAGLKKDIARVIRQLKPEVVVTMDPTVAYVAEHGFINHPDHRAAGQATLDAVYPLARDHLSFPDLFAEGYAPHKVQTLLLTNLKDHNWSQDISDVIDQKSQALAAHVSQGMAEKSLQDTMRNIAAADGAKAGLQYAETFMRIDIPT
jgi:LmbE family N-acetylglucosaminyl deacetylase